MDLLKKLGSLLSCYEDIRRRIQLSYAAFSNIRQVWFKENRHLENKFMLYKSLVKPVLTYSFGAWGLTMIKAQEIDIVQTVERQLRIIIKTFKINNMKLYEQCKEEPITAISYVLQLPEETPAEKVMPYYFETPESTKKYQGKASTTLAVSVHEDLRYAVKNGTNHTCQTVHVNR